MTELSVDDFQTAAREWLAANRAHAPRDYGAICPPDLVEAGLAWHRRVHEAGFAGIHWPTEFGGRGLTPAHNAAWQYEVSKRLQLYYCSFKISLHCLFNIRNRSLFCSSHVNIVNPLAIERRWTI